MINIIILVLILGVFFTYKMFVNSKSGIMIDSHNEEKTVIEEQHDENVTAEHRKDENTETSYASDNSPQAIHDAAVKIVQNYWTFNAAEKEDLLKKFQANALNYAQIYRLHHLACMEKVACVKQEVSFDESGNEIYKETYKDIIQKTTIKLLASDSPYREIHCSAWFRDHEPVDGGNTKGYLLNSSLALLGAVEVITLNKTFPVGIDFIPISQIAEMNFGRKATFTACRIDFEYGKRVEAFFSPTIHGLSYLTGKKMDKDGSMTRYIHQVEIPGFIHSKGIAVGVQSFMVSETKEYASLTSINGLAHLITNVDMTDVDCDKKCIARGINADHVRRMTKT
jgi:hypothetical protein